jgi:translation initiation factor IF-1
MAKKTLTKEEKEVLRYLYTTLTTTQINRALQMAGKKYEVWMSLQDKVFVKPTDEE